MITGQRVKMLRNLLTILALVTMLNSRTLAEGEWNLRLPVLPCQSYPGDRSEDAAALFPVALAKAFEEVETFSHGAICRVIRQRDVDSAAKRLGLSAADNEGHPVAWNADMVSRIAHEVNADTIVESHCYVRQNYDGQSIVDAALQFRDVASQECFFQKDDTEDAQSLDIAVQLVADTLVRRWGQTPPKRATVLTRNGSAVEINMGTNNGVRVGSLFFVTRQIDGHRVKVGNLRTVTVANMSAQAEVLNEIMPIGPIDVANRIYPDAFQRTPEQIRVSTIVQATTQITLERTTSSWRGPVYNVTVYRNGMVVYVCEDYVKRKGRFVGHISVWDFDRLAEVVEKLGFFQLDDHYAARATDMSSAIVTVRRAGNEKTVSDYGVAGPPAFWGIATLIDDVVAGITDWKKETAKKAPPGKRE